MEFLAIIIIILLTLLVSSLLFRNKNGLPTNWPFVGMLPAILINIHRFHDYSIEIFEKIGMTYEFKGPWFSNMHILATADPANIHHIMSKRFDNYVKGSKLQEITDALGDAIITSDSNIWDYHRKMAHVYFSHPNFQSYLIQITCEKAKNGLISVLDHASRHKIEIDLQDIFLRFMYDTMSVIMMNYDPNSLSIDLPDFPIKEAMADLEHVITYRHLVPTFIWKFMRWFKIGIERKQDRSWKIVDDFIYKQIYKKREERKQEEATMQKGQDTRVRVLDLLTFYMDREENHKDLLLTHNNTNNKPINYYKFLRDTILNFFSAGGETTGTTLSWFFYLLSKNPQVILKIRAELQIIDNYESFLRNFKEVNDKLIYLHAALCETIRLYPAVEYNPRGVLEPDILPSGHLATSNTQIICFLFVMGRIKSIWGDDCNEFKPERWITKQGTIKHEPSYKFSAFSAGPRSCLGKQIAFTQMKIVAATIIQNYHIEVEQYDCVPDVSLIPRMKNGIKVKIRRSLN